MKKLKIILQMIKFEHTIFALPFAYLGMVLGANGVPDFHTFFWITAAMVGARSYAMAVNRLADRSIDTRNPRTRNWPLPQGAMTVLETSVFVLCAILLFVFAAFKLPSLCHVLWPVALVPMTLLPCQPDDGEEVPADAGHVRFGDAQHRGGGDGGVDGVAALEEHAESGG